MANKVEMGYLGKCQFIGVLPVLGLHESSLVRVHNEHRILTHKIR